LLDGSWVDVRPKAMRWGIFHGPGRMVKRSRQRVVHIIDEWPGTDALLDAFRRIALLTRSHPASRNSAPG